MKILIIANGFTGATLPLANEFASRGYEVKCMYLVQIGTKSIESLDFESPIPISLGKMFVLPKSNKLYKYLNDKVDVCLMPVWKERKRLEKIGIGKLFTILNNNLLNRYIAQILDEKPDVVNLLVHNIKEVKIANALKKAGIPFTITYHEVLKGLVGTKVLKEEVKQTISLDTTIICHSYNTANELIQTADDSTLHGRVNVINFGSFDSYLSYGDGYKLKDLPTNYLLYLGHIHPYKGLKYLYDAINLLDESSICKIVIAGGGYDPVIDKMKSDNRFIVLNHFIDNDVLVYLIRNCTAIVCPYIAASQSGLVQTGMVFGKSIIATNVGAFTEIVQDGINGVLCNPADAMSLANAIKRFFIIKDKLETSKLLEQLNWEKIADKYINLYKILFTHKF